MQKKVYLKDLSLAEVLEILRKGKSIYYNSDSNIFYEYTKGFIIRYEYGKPTNIGSDIFLNGDYYFLDEVEEPEADESCIDKLCWFWCDNEYVKLVDILTEIKKEETYKYITKSNVWKHCRPLTKEEALALVKE